MAQALIHLLIAIVAIAVVAGLLVALVRRAPFLEQPFKDWIEWAIIAIAILCVILLVVPFTGVSI